MLINGEKFESKGRTTLIDCKRKIAEGSKIFFKGFNEMGRLNGKVAIVTGANSGMGKATVEALSDQGATVIMLCRSDKRGREAYTDLMQSGDRKLDLILADLGDYSSIRNFVRQVKEKYSRIDRNTGFGKTITGMLKPFFQTPAEGARTAIFLAMDDSVKGITGGYFYKSKIAKSSKRSKSRELARRLYMLSEELVNPHSK